jgi:hypothetical protein
MFPRSDAADRGQPAAPRPRARNRRPPSLSAQRLTRGAHADRIQMRPRRVSGTLPTRSRTVPARGTGPRGVAFDEHLDTLCARGGCYVGDREGDATARAGRRPAPLPVPADRPGRRPPHRLGFGSARRRKDHARQHVRGVEAAPHGLVRAGRGRRGSGHLLPLPRATTRRPARHTTPSRTPRISPTPAWPCA